MALAKGGGSRTENAKVLAPHDSILAFISCFPCRECWRSRLGNGGGGPRTRQSEEPRSGQRDGPSHLGEGRHHQDESLLSFSTRHHYQAAKLPVGSDYPVRHTRRSKRAVPKIKTICTQPRVETRRESRHLSKALALALAGWLAGCLAVWLSGYSVVNPATC